MNRFLVYLAVFMCQAALVGALEVPVLVAEERSLSFDIDPGFDVKKTTPYTDETGFFINEVDLTHTDQNGGAVVSVLSLYNDYMSRLPPAIVIELFQFGLISALEEDGGEIINYWDTRSFTGENVTVSTIQINPGSIEPDNRNYWLYGQSDIVYFGMWQLDDNNYAVTISTLDNTTTQKIIETLTIV